MNFRTLPLAALTPAPYNPRIELRPGSPGWEKIARSLSEFDLVQPLVWNERTGHVVGGHQRLAVLTSRGVTEVPCVVVDLPDDRERALNVALNNPAVGGAWDGEKLTALLAGLDDSGLDATLTGFDADDLSALLLEPVAPPADVGPEADTAQESADADAVRVTLVVPADDWDAVRADLDPVIAEHRLEVHVSRSS